MHSSTNEGVVRKIRESVRHGDIEAVRALLARKDVSHGDAPTYKLCGDLIADAGFLAVAADAYILALDREPTHVPALNNLALTLEDMGDRSTAQDLWLQAIELAPEIPDIHGNIAASFMEDDKRGDAIIHFRAAARLSGFDNKHGMNYAQFLSSFQAGGYDEALEKDLLQILAMEGVDFQALAPLCVDILRGHPTIASEVARRNGRDGEQLDLEALRGVPLLTAALQRMLLPHPDLEALIVRARRQLAHCYLEAEGSPSDRAGDLLAGIALQCELSEYVFDVTEEEDGLIDGLTARIVVSNDADFICRAATILAAYRDLNGCEAAYVVERAFATPSATPGERAILKRHFHDRRTEAELKAAMPSLTPIATEDPIVEHYESYPYPRWNSCFRPSKESARTRFSGRVREALGHDWLCENPIQYLVAGCGTGKQAIAIAARFDDVSVCAIDLSLSSLAHAARCANELGLMNISFARADLRALPNEGRQFDVVEAVGVIHHLEDSEAALRDLMALCRPGGLIKLGLYSAAARAPLRNIKTLLRSPHSDTELRSVRALRQNIVRRFGSTARQVTEAKDFYSANGFRDLVLNPRERAFTLREIDGMINSAGLDLISFELNPGQIAAFGQRFPAGTAARDLGCWEQFERENPETFGGMYQFWLKVPESPI